jgi:alkane 1-monooxygenase
MDPKVLAHVDGDMSRANISPRKRARILAANPSPATASIPVAVPTGQPSVGVAGDAMRAACPGCGYTYDVERGNPREGLPAGTAWSAVPDSWCCPDCGVREKADFVIEVGA